MGRQETRKSLTDEYEISDILGRGGFSVVRKGTHKSSIGANKHVAIKTLRRFSPFTQPRNPKSTVPATKQALISDALLTNELLVMRRIVEDVSPHPNVIHLYDVCEDNGGVHLVLELCSGGELFDRIVAQERYNEAGAAAVVRQIAGGLAALHRAGVVHRDLKPENCLFLSKDEDSTLKIMDFGLSSVEDFTDPVVGLFGSIDYVAPEALSRDKISPKSDIWSLGVILYILLSGYPPFIAQSNRQKQQMILNGQFSFYEKTWKNISSSVKELITILLKVDPDLRPSAEEILRHPWVTGELAKQEQMDAEIVSRLQSFNARRKFRAAAMASMLSSSFSLRTKKLKNLVGSYDLKPEELEKLSVNFKKVCKSENATLPEFEEVLKGMEMLSLVPLAPRIFDLFDNNRDGTVDMREIIGGFSSLKYSQGDDALRLCFQMYDTDRSGCISKEELASLLRALPDDYIQIDITEPGKLDEIFDLMDANSDGKVTFEEFKAAMQRDSSLQDVVLSSLRPNQS
ncbi:calcium and calcium/calmodulin-dependent serine/threonine-protein kinase [Sesamum indicum]|uniref:calcium/calmodulin-dependent protein kinase n=1 Tax=Sesamum indicum TaxID=4182 RepID=A0A6I9TXA3_SESIN|nr:calcium and calcium/calmodulin-dependent serine/threonine-protein kinase [Sesamum indicum]